MKCLLKYQWVKLPCNQMPMGKGIMGAWALKLFTPPKGMDSYACPETSRSVSQRRIITLMSRTHGWISGATLYGRIPAMRFLIWRHLSNLANVAPF